MLLGIENPWENSLHGKLCIFYFMRNYRIIENVHQDRGSSEMDTVQNVKSPFISFAFTYQALIICLVNPKYILSVAEKKNIRADTKFRVISQSISH